MTILYLALAYVEKKAMHALAVGLMAFSKLSLDTAISARNGWLTSSSRKITRPSMTALVSIAQVGDS